MIVDAKSSQVSETKTRVFISYSRKNMAFADRLETALEARGFEPMIDRTEIYAFEDWWKRIEALISRADTIVFVLSPQSVASEVALKEVTYAASLNKRFAPIVCEPVDGKAVPEQLRRLNFIFFDDPARFEASVHQLAEALQTDISWIRRHTDLGDAARHWIETGQASGLLLRPPALDQAEAWLAYRPRGAPHPTAETEAFITESRKAETAARRRSRALHVALYVMLVGIILGLVGWINQDTIKEQSKWYFVTTPYMRAQIRPHVLSAERETALKPLESFRECAKDCPEMIVLPAGRFMMGSVQGAGDTDEHPQHQVTFDRPFAVAKYELTFDDWDACAAYGDCDSHIGESGWGRGRQPAINVTWDDAQRYVAWLSKMTGKPYRLLSEAEWEYAARGGTQSAYPWGDDLGAGHANCDGCGSRWDGKRPAPVGSFAANAFGLHDMQGNLREWLEDCYQKSYDGAPNDGAAWTAIECPYRVVRDGSWGYPNPPYSAFRWRDTPVDRSLNTGFRVGRTLTP